MSVTKMFGAEEFPKINTGTDLVESKKSANELSGNNYGGVTSKNVNPIFDLKETFIEMSISLRDIARNTFETSELLRPTDAEKRDKNIGAGDTDKDKPKDKPKGFVDRLKGLNPFKEGLGTNIPTFLLALAAFLGLKLFGDKLIPSIAKFLESIKEGKIGEKIEEIYTDIKERLIPFWKEIKVQVGEFIEGVKIVFGLIMGASAAINEYVMQFDTGGAGPAGMFPDGKLDKTELSNMFKDLKEKIVTPIVEEVYNIAALAVTGIISGLGLISISGILSRLNPLALPPTGDNEKNKKKKSKLSKFLKVGRLGKFGVLALGGIVVAGLLSFATDAALAINEAMNLPDQSDMEKEIDAAMGNKQPGFVNKLLSAFVVGEETGNKITDVLANGFNKGLMGGALGAATFTPFGITAGVVGGLIFGALSAYFGEEKVSNAIELMFGDETPFGKIMDFLHDSYMNLILTPFEFIFGKLGVKNDSFLSRLGANYDKKTIMTEKNLYGENVDPNILANKTTTELLSILNENKLAAQTLQPTRGKLGGFNFLDGYGKFDKSLTGDQQNDLKAYNLIIERVEKELDGRGVNPTEAPDFLQTDKLGNDKIKVVPREYTLKEVAQRQKLGREIDSIIANNNNNNDNSMKSFHETYVNGALNVANPYHSPGFLIARNGRA